MAIKSVFAPRHAKPLRLNGLWLLGLIVLVLAIMVVGPMLSAQALPGYQPPVHASCPSAVGGLALLGYGIWVASAFTPIAPFTAATYVFMGTTGAGLGMTAFDIVTDCF